MGWACSLFREFRVLYYNLSCLQLFPRWNHQKFGSRQHSSVALEADGAIPSVHSVATKFCDTYAGCPGIQLYWISREPVAWPWRNLAASRRRTYCACVNSHSPVGLVSRQWDAVYWACVLCDRRIQNDRANRSASSRQCACPFYSSRAGFFFLQSITSPGSVGPPPSPYSPDLAPCDFWLFQKLKSPLKGKRFVNATTHSNQAQSTASHCRLTPYGRVIVRGGTLRSPLAAKLHQGHATGSRDIQNGRILSGQSS
jgi:hypothetical protein